MATEKFLDFLLKMAESELANYYFPPYGAIKEDSHEQDN
jgi:hypothetical protein